MSQENNQTTVEAIPKVADLWQIPGMIFALLIFFIAAYIASHPMEAPSSYEADRQALALAYESGNTFSAVTSAQKFLARYPASDAEAFARFVLAYSTWQLTMSNPAATRRDLSSCLASFRKAVLLGLPPAYLAGTLRAQGDILIRLGLANEAADAYSALLDRFPSENKALLELALAYSLQTPPSIEKARESIDRYLAIEGLSPEEVQKGYIAKARMELSVGDYESARASAMIVLDSTSQGETAAQAAIILHDVIDLQNDPDAALAVLDRADVNTSGRFESSLLLARAKSLWRTGRADEARKLFDDAIFRYPGTSDALSARYELAHLLFKSENLDAAKDALINLLDDMSAQQTIVTDHFSLTDVTELWFAVGRRILDLEDFNAARDFHSAAAALMSQGHFLFFDAALYLREAEQLQTLLPGLSLQQADAAREAVKKAYTEAGQLFAKVLATASGDIYDKALYNAGHCFYMARDYAVAAHYLGAFASSAIKDERVPQALYEQARALADLGRYEPAIIVCRENAERHPTNIYAYRSILLQGDLYRSLGGPSLEQSASIYAGILTDVRFLATSTEWRSAIFSLGITLYRLGDFKNSMLKLDEALERFPDEPRVGEARYYLALASRQVAFAEPALKKQLLLRAAGLFAEIASSSDAVSSHAQNAAFLEADCYYDLDDFARALSLYDRAVETYVDTPDATRALVQRANGYHRLGQTQQADATFKRAVFNLNREGRAPAPGAPFYRSLAEWRTQGEA